MIVLIYVQWARRTPQDYQPFGSESWATTPAKADPSRGSTYALNQLDNQPGWVAELSVQGVAWNEDHYHVRDLTDGSSGIVVTAWTDTEPFVTQAGGRQAQVWTILPLAADGRFGGALNTRQSRVVYADGEALTRWQSAPAENTVVQPYAAFVAPPAAEVRHGIWLADAAWTAHVNARTAHGWREWA